MSFVGVFLSFPWAISIKAEVRCVSHEHTSINHTLYPWGQSFSWASFKLRFFYSVEEQPMYSGLVGHLMAITWYLPMPWITLAPLLRSSNERAGRPTWTSWGTGKLWLLWWVSLTSEILVPSWAVYRSDLHVPSELRECQLPQGVSLGLSHVDWVMGPRRQCIMVHLSF